MNIRDQTIQMTIIMAQELQQELQREQRGLQREQRGSHGPFLRRGRNRIPCRPNKMVTAKQPIVRANGRITFGKFTWCGSFREELQNAHS